MRIKKSERNIPIVPLARIRHLHKTAPLFCVTGAPLGLFHVELDVFASWLLATRCQPFNYRVERAHLP